MEFSIWPLSQRSGISQSKEYKSRFGIFRDFRFSPNLRRTVLRDYWADYDVRTCYGDLLDLYLMKKIFFQKKYFFFIEIFLFQNHDFLKNLENFEKIMIFSKNHDFFKIFKKIMIFQKFMILK